MKPRANSIHPEKHNRLFGERGYVVVRKVIEPPNLAIYATYALMQRFNNYYEIKDHTFSRDRYADLLGESMLLHLKPVVEKATSLNLLPTYSYLRIYQAGSVLEKHIDRPACEISATIVLGYHSPEIWPLWVESQDEAIAVHLDRGDMLIYRGCEVPHWRERFDGQYWIQMFLHYIDAEGEFTAYKYDRRLMLGSPIRHPDHARGKADAAG